MTAPGPALPFNSTVAGARRYVVSISAEGQRPAGWTAPKRTSDDTVAEWLIEAGALVQLRIRAYVALPATPADVQITGQLTQDQVIATARHLVELYAAALILDVNLPERSSQMRGESGRGPGAPLMDRFYKLLADLDAAIDAATQPDQLNVADAGAAVCAPPPRFPAGMGF